VLSGFIAHRTDVGILNLDVQAFVSRQFKKFVVNIVGVLTVALEAEDRKSIESLWLVDHLIKTVGVVEHAVLETRSVRGVLRRGARALSLGRKVWSFVNSGFIKNFCLNGVGGQFDIKSPLLNLFTLSDHSVKLANRVDAVLRLLEKTLAHCSHSALVFTHFLRDADEHAEFRRKVDVLAFLLDFKKRLIKTDDLLVVLLLEIHDHGDCCSLLALFELASFGAHVPTHGAHLVGLVMAVACHDNGAFEFIVNRFLNFS